MGWDWEHDIAERLSPKEEAKVATQLVSWKTATKKIGHKIPDQKMVEMLRLSGKLGGDAHQLREANKQLGKQRTKLRKLVSKHAEHMKEVVGLLQPAEPGFGISALTIKAVESLELHGAQLRALADAYAALADDREATLFQLTSPQRRIAKGESHHSASLKKTLDPQDFDAGVLVEFLSAECKLTESETVLLITLYDQIGTWPMKEPEVVGALVRLIRDAKDPLRQTAKRVQKQRRRRLDRKKGMTLLVPWWSTKKP